MSRAKTATEQVKNQTKKPHLVSPIPEGFPGSRSADSMVVSTPAEVNELLSIVPEGRLVTLESLRQFLANRHGADIACPVSTAIYMNVVARAAEEQRHHGEHAITPYWRALKPGGELNPKYPGGVAAQRAKLEAEGFSIVQRRKGLAVEGYEDFLYRWEDV